MKTKLTITLVSLCLVFFLFNCSSENEKESNENLTTLSKDDLKIEKNKDLNTYASNLRGKILKSDIFKDLNTIKDFEIKYVDLYKSDYLYGKALDSDGNHVVFRQKIEVSKHKDGSQTLRLLPIGEKCTGVNCSKCSFANDGGCDCDRAGEPTQSSYCNHSTSTGD
ncbi:hypothetical protein [Bizionia paragorgiae]|uniref:Lipoprotein n=1 Tax=Bizionia paragorgiae TaxID=283786 RepID=A0A1H3YH39_BIZPA|nr:hypothetical protein [Bizionia paragorgiae]MDX1272746.1 hypothetical protein [Bizionia paragorgiae]SEA10198.1 hypothetical protein SAMN04487990_106173 [Bizionia paragorgiae]